METEEMESQRNLNLKHLVRMRNTFFLFIAVISLQFWIGMTINLEVNIPVKHLGPISSLFYFGSHFTFVLIHIANGLFILTIAIILVTISFMNSRRSLRIVSLIALFSVVGAIVNGILFLASGQFFGWSIGMAMSAVSALVSASIGLFYVGHSLGLSEKVGPKKSSSGIKGP
jgi:hypothetical protein